MKWFIFIFDIFITNSSSPGFMDIKKNITIHCDNRRLVRKLKNVFTPWWLLLRKSFPLLLRPRTKMYPRAHERRQFTESRYQRFFVTHTKRKHQNFNATELT